ncbi:UDP-N-acetylmuramoylalanine--D-glutamate ligase [uncultured Gammaproteobacteria bacterium]
MIDLSLLRGQVVAVMGLGKSGLATAEALVCAGVEAWVWDDNADRRAQAAALGARVVDLTAVELTGADLAGVAGLVLSPGIPHTYPQPHPVAVRARAAGVPIIGDIDLLGRAQTEATYVGITGTNGKSTTTALIGHLLRALGTGPVEVGGNLGTPVLTFAPLGKNGLYVLEMSSYQLELTPSVRFKVAVLLNITPDHLDRHGGMDGYIKAKSLIFDTQGTGDTAVIGVDDEGCRKIYQELSTRPGVRVVPISVERALPGGVWVRDGRLFDHTGSGVVEVTDLNGIQTLPGSHNWQNAAAAYAACRALGLETDKILAAMASFPGLAHRQQRVGVGNGVVYVNDSKATNVDAAAKALVCYRPIYWIIGGRAKDSGLDGLEPLMERVRHAYVIGEATERFAVWLTANRVSFERCGTLDKAVAAAAQRAETERLPGACVLLSPACASWDQFTSFEQRGEVFADLVGQRIGPESVPGAAGGATLTKPTEQDEGARS